MRIDKILCIQHRQMGDVLMCTSAVRQLHEKLPNAEIHFLTENPGAQVLKYNTNINHIIEVPRNIKISDSIKLIKNIRREKYDAVIDFFGNPRSGLLTALSGAKYRCGFRNPAQLWAYNYSRKFTEECGREYAAKTKARLLELIDLEPPARPSIEMPFGNDEKQFAEHFWKDVGFNVNEKVIAFCPVSRRDYKMWKPEYFAELADALIDKYSVKLLVIYGPGEKDLASAITDKMKRDAILDYPMPTILQLRAILEKCAMYVGNDGGNKHIAITAGLPTATLFRQLNPANWTPPNDERHVFVAEGGSGQPLLDVLKPNDLLKEIEKIEHYLK